MILFVLIFRPKGDFWKIQEGIRKNASGDTRLFFQTKRYDFSLNHFRRPEAKFHNLLQIRLLQLVCPDKWSKLPRKRFRPRFHPSKSLLLLELMMIVKYVFTTYEVNNDITKVAPDFTP